MPVSHLPPPASKVRFGADLTDSSLVKVLYPIDDSRPILNVNVISPFDVDFTLRANCAGHTKVDENQMFFLLQLFPHGMLYR